MYDNPKKQQLVMFNMKKSWERLTDTGRINKSILFNIELQKQIFAYECKLGLYDIYEKCGLKFVTLHSIRYHRSLNYFMKTRTEALSIDRETVLQIILDEMGIVVSESTRKVLKKILEKDFERRTPLLLERMVLEHNLWSYHSRNLVKGNKTDADPKQVSTFGRFQTQVYEYPFIKFWFLMSKRSSKKEETKEIWAKLHTAFRKEILELRPEYKERYSDEKAWKKLQKCFSETLELVLSGKDVPNKFESDHFPWLIKMIYDYTYKTISTSKTYAAYTEYAFLYLESILWGNTITNIFDVTAESQDCPVAYPYYLIHEPLEFQKINSEINTLLVKAISDGKQDWVDAYDDLMWKVKQQYLFFFDSAYWDIEKLTFERWKIGRQFCGNGYRLNIGECFFEGEDLFHLNNRKTRTAKNSKNIELLINSDLQLITKISNIFIEDDLIKEAVTKSIRRWYNFYLTEPEYASNVHSVRKRIMSEFMNYILHDKRDHISDLFEIESQWDLETPSSIEKLRNKKRNYKNLRIKLEHSLWSMEYKIPQKLPHTSKSPEQLYVLLHKEFTASIFATPITELKPWKNAPDTETTASILNEIELSFESHIRQALLDF